MTTLAKKRKNITFHWQLGFKSCLTCWTDQSRLFWTSGSIWKLVKMPKINFEKGVLELRSFVKEVERRHGIRQRRETSSATLHTGPSSWLSKRLQSFSRRQNFLEIKIFNGSRFAKVQKLKRETCERRRLVIGPSPSLVGEARAHAQLIKCCVTKIRGCPRPRSWRPTKRRPGE